MPERHETDPSAAERGAQIQHAGADLAYMRANHEVFRLDFPPTGGFLRLPLGLARRLLRRLLAPILARQAAYNRANVGVASSVLGAVEELRREVAELSDRLAQQETSVAERIDRLAQQETTALEALQRAVVDELEQLGQKQSEALSSLPEDVLARVDSRVRDLERTVLRQREQLGLQERRLTMLLEE